MTTFAPANDKRRLKGVLVQLVRMPACHAGGHEFEPRTHRLHKHNSIGVLVQLVRMPACHAGGHEFEPRTYRKTASLSFRQRGCFAFVC